MITKVFKTHLLILSLLVVAKPALSQNVTIKDSVELLNTLASSKAENFPEEAKLLIRKSIELSERDEFRPGIAKAHYILGRVLYYQYMNEEAINAFQTSLENYKYIHDSTGISSALNGLGNIYKSRFRDFNSALDYYQKANQYAVTKRQQAITLFSIATIYSYMNQEDEAIKIHKQVYQIAQEINDPLQVANALDAMGFAYGNKEQYEEAIRYYKQSIELYSSLNSHENYARSLSNLGALYGAAKNYKEAEASLLDALTFAKAHSFNAHEIGVSERLADVYFNQGDLENCEKYLLIALEKSEATKIKKYDAEIFEDLSALYKALGDPERALEYQTRYTKISDSIRFEQEKKNFDRIIAKEPTSNVVTHSDNSSSINVLWVSFSIILACSAMSLIYFKRKRSGKQEGDFISSQVNVSEKNSPTHIDVVCGEGVKHQALESIWWFQYESADRSYYAFIGNETYRIKQNMADLESLLPPYFFRVNRSGIININMLYNYSFWEHHKYILRMKDTNRTEFTIARSRLKELKEIVQMNEVITKEKVTS